MSLTDLQNARPTPQGLNRLFCRVLGVALLTAAAGLWVLPGSLFAMETLLLKFGLTLFLLGGSATLLTAPR
ncbi:MULTISPECIES: hypothetical protein [unclassified Rhodosalinus]|uniref:hypothetical protein n=1 Tax=unclassified Rhodosalinus TaxID=2630183 RepID=UPI003524F4C4